MDTGSEEFKRLIFNLMNGELDLEKCPVTESKYVVDEFQDGKPCSIAYEKVFDANRRLCQRLGVEEDNDVEIIVNNLLYISEYLSLKMYDYGRYFTDPSIRYS